MMARSLIHHGDAILCMIIRYHAGSCLIRDVHCQFTWQETPGLWERFGENFFVNLLTIRVSSRIVRAIMQKGQLCTPLARMCVSRFSNGLNPSSAKDWSHHGYGTD